MNDGQRLEARPARETEYTSLLRQLKTRLGSWRVTVFLGVVTACLVLVANLTLLAWAVNNAPIDGDGTAVVFEGSCEVSDNATLWPDFLINILSTLLLGASNNCAQILAAPTREDIDNAHANGKWLDIGVPSTRNLAHIPRQRAILWGILFLSSVPLHLVYNSVVFQGLGWISHDVRIVTEDFAEGRWWNKTRESQASLKHLEDLQASVLAGNFTRFENEECIRRFENPPPQTAWKRVLLVTHLDIHTMEFDPIPGDIRDKNLCKSGCATTAFDNGTTAWNIGFDTCQPLFYESVNDINQPANCSAIQLPVSYCLAEPATPRCTVNVSLTLLSIVIAFNLVKIICLVVTMFCGRDRVPLLTAGDAIASFLEQPDPTTANMGPISRATVQNNIAARKKNWIQARHTFTKTTHCWFQASSGGRWAACIGLFFIVWMSGAALLHLAFTSYPVGFTESFSGSPMNRALSSHDMSLLASVLLSNTPQLLISFTYLFYNSILTYMVLSHEYGRFATVRKPLRVSQPSPYGTQRSSFWLQLPYRYILPMMTAMALLHWTVSRSLYLIQLTVYDPDGVQIPLESFKGCGFSAYPILFSLIIGVAMMIALLWLSRRYLEPTVPLAASCSLAISAATHAAQGETDAAVMPIQYGIVPAAGVDEEGRGRIGFSSEPVEPLGSSDVYG